jgi:predicted dehydrogenase
VLVEKPMTIKSEDAWDLVDVADQLDRHLLLSYGWNYLPMMSSAKALMDDPGVGRIEQISLQMGSVTRDLLFGTGGYPDASKESPPESKTWTDPGLSGGGYAMAQLTHALGCALWLTGLRGKEVFAFMSAPEGAPVEFYDAVSLRFSNGAIGTMSGGATHAGAGDDKSQLNLRVIGAEGQFHIDFEREDIWLYRGRETDIRPALASDAGLYNCVGPPHGLVDLALGRTDRNLSPGWLGARTAEILEACYRSAAERSVAEIKSDHHDSE